MKLIKRFVHIKDEVCIGFNQFSLAANLGRFTLMIASTSQIQNVQVAWIDKEITKTEELNESISRAERFSGSLHLELCLSSSDASAELAEKRSDIYCVIDKIQEFLRNKKTYESFQAVYHVLSLLDEYRQLDKSYSFKDSVLETIRAAIDLHASCLKRMKSALEHISLLASGEPIPFNRLRRLCVSLEVLAEDLEDNYEFFPYESLSGIGDFCIKLIENCRNAKYEGGFKSASEENRRRLRYSAGFILNLLDDLECNTEEAENEAREDFLSIIHWPDEVT